MSCYIQPLFQCLITFFVNSNLLPLHHWNGLKSLYTRDADSKVHPVVVLFLNYIHFKDLKLVNKPKVDFSFFKGLLRMNSAEIMADLSNHTPMMHQSFIFVLQ